MMVALDRVTLVTFTADINGFCAEATAVDVTSGRGVVVVIVIAAAGPAVSVVVAPRDSVGTAVNVLVRVGVRVGVVLSATRVWSSLRPTEWTVGVAVRTMVAVARGVDVRLATLVGVAVGVAVLVPVAVAVLVAVAEGTAVVTSAAAAAVVVRGVEVTVGVAVTVPVPVTEAIGVVVTGCARLTCSDAVCRLATINTARLRSRAMRAATGAHIVPAPGTWCLDA